MHQQRATRDRHSDTAFGPTAATGRSDGGARRARVKSISHPARENGRPGAGLIESERLFQKAFERAVIGIAHVSPEGRFLRFNRRLCDLLGYDRAELAALTFRDVTHPDDLDPCGAYFQRLLAGELDEYALEKRYIRKDGTPVWAHVAVSLVRTPAGEPDFTITMVQDITTRKRLEQERERLLERERAARAQAEASEARAAERAEQLRAILETMADGVVVLGQDGRHLQTNRAYRELLAAGGAPPVDVASPGGRCPLLDVRDPATGEPLPCERVPARRALRGEVVAGPGVDVRARALDGRELDVNASAAPLHDGDGRVVGAVMVLRDVTERNRLAREREAARADELAAREVSRRMEEFVAVAAHDLRTPLTATLGFLALAERQFQRLASVGREEGPGLVPRVESARHYLGEAGRGAERLAHLVEVLFDTSAIRAGRLELRRAACDLAALVGARVAEQRVAAPGRTIRLHAPSADGAPVPPVPVEADADRIGQALTNYLTNALKYSPPDRPVDVSVEARIERGEESGEREGWARVAVRDRGPGLPEAERGRVWEPFHRAPGVAGAVQGEGGAREGSLGLGLYICKAIVEAHGGQVGVESAAGEGSTFWFSLPLAHAAAA
jgi:PAS domain S-box-containing protein